MGEELLPPLDERVRLAELVDRVLDKGVVLRGDVTLGVAGIDLVYLDLRLLLSSVETLERRSAPPVAGPVARSPEEASRGTPAG